MSELVETAPSGKYVASVIPQPSMQWWAWSHGGLEGQQSERTSGLELEKNNDNLGPTGDLHTRSLQYLTAMAFQ